MGRSGIVDGPPRGRLQGGMPHYRMWLGPATAGIHMTHGGREGWKGHRGGLVGFPAMGSLAAARHRWSRASSLAVVHAVAGAAIVGRPATFGNSRVLNQKFMTRDIA